MAHTLVFSKIAINSLIFSNPSSQCVNACEILEENGRDYLVLKFTEEQSWRVDVQNSVMEFKHIALAPEPETNLILDFRLTIESLPSWLMPYSKAASDCLHIMIVTLKMECSKPDYADFVKDFRSTLVVSQCQALDNSSAAVLWDERCAPHSSRIVDYVKIIPKNFSNFSTNDLDRLKNDDKWLSDSHITLALLDCFRCCASRNIWKNLKIKLFDTSIWQMLSNEPEKYCDRFMAKNNLMECDFAVVPMFEGNHWRLGIVENPRGFEQGNTLLHILDSLPNNSIASKEAKRLQLILLNHFETLSFDPLRIKCHIPLVPRQPNSKDCGCFVVYFGKKFLNDPMETTAVIKTVFNSPAEATKAWGLKNSDLTFVRREIRTLLLRYISRGDAVVEFK